MEYFRIQKALSNGRNWFLDTPRLPDGTEPDIWAFTSSKPLSFTEPLYVPIQRRGDVVDVAFSHYDIPYVMPRIGRIFEAFAGDDIQRLPARLDTGDDIEILNVLTALDAFDHAHSEATYCDGKPNMVMTLRVLPDVADGHHAFRLIGWPGPLLVSDLILEHLRRVGASGFTATKVS